MSARGMLRLWITVVSICAAGSAAAAPWGNLISLKSVEADPNQNYQVTENNGPWMVMACSFSGEGAEKQAKELVIELRKRYKISAYSYLGRFDPGEAQGRGIDKYGNQKKANYYKFKDEKDKEKARRPELVEYAVLVGDFRSAGDKKAQSTLQMLKYATPQCLEIKEGQATHQTLTGWRLAQQQVYEMIGSEKKKFGPMRHAFIIPNPVLPADFFNQRTIDEETVALNKDVPYSLLECPGMYTVQVATFKGMGVIKQSDIRDIQEGRKEMSSQLAVAAQKANDLAVYLRAKGYDAYQYHDRFMSVVTVGSFKSRGRTLPNGQVELDPEIQTTIDAFRAGSPSQKLRAQATVQNTLRAVSASDVGRQVVDVQPQYAEIREHEYIPFDVQPVLVQVPKRSISAAFGDGE